MICLFVCALSLALVNGQTDAEIRAATKAIWESDLGKLCDHELRYESTGVPKLFKHVDESKLVSPTWNIFKELLTAYNPNEGEPDQCDQTCVDREWAFVDAMLDTAPMQTAHSFIGQHAPELADVNSFRSYLHFVWFTPYNRHAANDSSAFQHVFVGELKIEGNDIGGFHNWYQIYQQEIAGLFSVDSQSGQCSPDVPKFSMFLTGIRKAINSVWMRSTPEAEFAVYTLTFRFRPNRVFTINIDNYDVDIQTWDEDLGNGEFAIGTAYVRC